MDFMQLGGIAAGLLGGWLTKKASKKAGSGAYKVLAPVGAVLAAGGAAAASGEAAGVGAAVTFGIQNGALAVLGWDVANGARKARKRD